MSSPSSPPSSELWAADEADWLGETDDADATGAMTFEPHVEPHVEPRLVARPARETENVLNGDALIAAISGPDHGGSPIGQELSAITRTSRKDRARARHHAAKAAKRAHRRKPLWRGRILPKSVLGISLLMLAAGVGAAGAGTALYMNYQYRRDQSDALVQSFPERAKIAVDTVNAEAINARRRIQDEIEPIRKLAATGDTLRELLAKAAPSVFQVSTFDVDGAASSGTAFVVASDSTRSFLITSYAVVRAATVRPGPSVTVRQGSDVIPAELWTWQEQRDLALLIVQKPNLPRLEWAISTDVRLGQQIFAISGVGTAGGSITQGFTADVSVDGVQHTAPLGKHFRGGPLVTDRGAVLAVASRGYAPLGFDSDGVWFAPPIRTVCETVVKCPKGEVTGGGQVTGVGSQRT